MKDKLETNMYVRTKWGYICKIINMNDFREPNMKYGVGASYLRDVMFIGDDDVVKASYNIIDILEVGDYVNGSEVLDFENKYIEEKDTFVPIGVVTENCYLKYTDSWIIEKNIKSVITHEQIEQMAYKVGE